MKEIVKLSGLLKQKQNEEAPALQTPLESYMRRSCHPWWVLQYRHVPDEPLHSHKELHKVLPLPHAEPTKLLSQVPSEITSLH